MKAEIRTTTIVKWKQIEDFPDYHISNNGLIRRGNVLLIPKILKRKVCLYKWVILRPHGQKMGYKKDVHRLVWDHFGDRPRPKGYDVHHIDEDCHNNHISNLEILTKLEHKQKHKKAA